MYSPMKAHELGNQLAVGSKYQGSFGPSNLSPNAGRAAGEFSDQNCSRYTPAAADDCGANPATLTVREGLFSEDLP